MTVFSFMCQKIFDDSPLVTILRPHHYFIHSPFLTVAPVSLKKQKKKQLRWNNTLESEIQSV